MTPVDLEPSEESSLALKSQSAKDNPPPLSLVPAAHPLPASAKSSRYMIHGLADILRARQLLRRWRGPGPDQRLVHRLYVTCRTTLVDCRHVSSLLYNVLIFLRVSSIFFTAAIIIIYVGSTEHHLRVEGLSVVYPNNSR